MFLRTIILAVAFLTFVGTAPAQTELSDVATWTVDINQNYSTIPNVTYSVANNYECKLDAYVRKGADAPVPTVVSIHGGGWVAGKKETAILWLLPYFEMGFSVVNVEYRLAEVSLAPAAVEDCRLALIWVFKNAEKYGFDTSRIVVTGGSAGGHLSLMTGMLTPEAGFDSPRNWQRRLVPPPRVSAIVNWYGITDVADLLSGPNTQEYAVSWLGSQSDRVELAKRVSPLTYIRKDLPPILTIHGTKDKLVPYEHAVQLHKGLDEKGVANKLITIPEGGHGGFSRDQIRDIQKQIRAFLKEHGII
ncbi:MAG: alpha/beta hydrolase [Bacteroidota bacterium]